MSEPRMVEPNQRRRENRQWPSRSFVGLNPTPAAREPDTRMVSLALVMQGLLLSAEPLASAAIRCLCTLGGAVGRRPWALESVAAASNGTGHYRRRGGSPTTKAADTPRRTSPHSVGPPQPPNQRSRSFPSARSQDNPGYTARTTKSADHIPGTIPVLTYHDYFTEYRAQPEHKALGANGLRCHAWTRGRLQPPLIIAATLARVGKETVVGAENNDPFTPGQP